MIVTSLISCGSSKPYTKLAWAHAKFVQQRKKIEACWVFRRLHTGYALFPLPMKKGNKIQLEKIFFSLFPYFALVCFSFSMFFFFRIQSSVLPSWSAMDKLYNTYQNPNQFRNNNLEPSTLSTLKLLQKANCTWIFSLCILQNPWNIARGICNEEEEKLESSSTVFGSALAPFWLVKPSFPLRTQRLKVVPKCPCFSWSLSHGGLLSDPTRRRDSSRTIDTICQQWIKR